MASNIQEYVEKIEEDLQCSMCLNVYNLPKELPCQHAFCKEPGMTQLVNEEAKNIQCPICRQVHALPLEGIEGFTSSLILQSILDTREEVSTKASLSIVFVPPDQSECKYLFIYFVLIFIESKEELVLPHTGKVISSYIRE